MHDTMWLHRLANLSRHNATLRLHFHDASDVGGRLVMEKFLEFVG